MTNKKALVTTVEGVIVTTPEDILGDDRGLQRRGPDGLLLTQRQFLQELMVQGSWRKACAVLKIRERRVRGWLENDESFSKAYDDLFSVDDTKHTRRELALVAARAAGLYEEAIEAERGVRQAVTCPECGKKFDVNTLRPDWRIRMRAMETALKATKILQETKEVKGTTYNVNLTGDEYITLLAISAGKTVPESARARLRAKGIEV